MVFNVSGNLKEGKVDLEKQLDGQSPEDALVRTKKPVVVKSNTCCLVLPWFLLCVSLILMGCVASWGWKEHTKLLDMRKMQQASEPYFLEDELPPIRIDDNDGPFLNGVGKDLDLGVIDEGGLTDEMYDDSNDEIVGTSSTTTPPTTTTTTTTTPPSNDTAPERSWLFFRLPQFPFFRPAGDGQQNGNNPVFFRFRFLNFDPPQPEESVPDVEKSGDEEEKVN